MQNIQNDYRDIKYFMGGIIVSLITRYFIDNIRESMDVVSLQVCVYVTTDDMSRGEDR